MKKTTINFELRPAAHRDAGAIAEIYNHEVMTSTATFDLEPKPLVEIEGWVAGRKPEHPLWVAVEDGVVVGFSGLVPHSPRMAYAKTVENTVYMRSNRRQSGGGKRLLEAVLEEGRRAGIHTVIARISTDNEGSLALHRKLGFTAIGTLREVGTKFGQLRDVAILQLML